MNDLVQKQLFCFWNLDNLLKHILNKFSVSEATEVSPLVENKWQSDTTTYSLFSLHLAEQQQQLAVDGKNPRILVDEPLPETADDRIGDSYQEAESLQQPRKTR
jgi:hypothetical protein